MAGPGEEQSASSITVGLATLTRLLTDPDGTCLVRPEAVTAAS